MRSLREREGDMADDKLREAALKPIATIKKPVIAAEKKEEAKTVEKTVAKKPAVTPPVGSTIFGGNYCLRYCNSYSNNTLNI